MKKLLLSLIFIVSFSSLTFALTFVVNNNGDTNDANTADNLCADASGNCTLRAAIQQANVTAGDDTITFTLVSPSIINLTIGELVISSNITIAGTGARNLTVQRGTSANFRIFYLEPSNLTSVNISALTISGGSGTASCGGGIFFSTNQSSPTLTLTEVTITSNTSFNGDRKAHV